MKVILLNLKRFFTLKIRKRRRRRASNDLLVMMQAMPGYYPIDDINSGGLSFRYIENGARPKKGIYRIKLVVKGQSLSLRLLGKTVGDREIGSIAMQNQVIKRCNIRFELLDSSQKRILEEIIKGYTVNQPAY